MLTAVFCVFLVSAVYEDDDQFLDDLDTFDLEDYAEIPLGFDLDLGEKALGRELDSLLKDFDELDTYDDLVTTERDEPDIDNAFWNSEDALADDDAYMKFGDALEQVRDNLLKEPQDHSDGWDINGDAVGNSKGKTLKKIRHTIRQSLLPDTPVVTVRQVFAESGCEVTSKEAWDQVRKTASGRVSRLQFRNYFRATAFHRNVNTDYEDDYNLYLEQLFDLGYKMMPGGHEEVDTLGKHCFTMIAPLAFEYYSQGKKGFCTGYQDDVDMREQKVGSPFGTTSDLSTTSLLVLGILLNILAAVTAYRAWCVPQPGSELYVELV